jgi:hypothetical protein
LSVYFVILPIIIFCILLGVFVFSFCFPYHAHKLDFCSSSCVFLEYSSSYLNYHYFDLASHPIYVSRHVHFHENIFSFVNYEQITHSPVPSIWSSVLDSPRQHYPQQLPLPLLPPSVG